ncbi:UNVERIFIED_CONTAM: hypothetical protein GTU68_024731 [Idotea baltica]|nr:hypothetical protein [Idotea baltica]
MSQEIFDQVAAKANEIVAYPVNNAEELEQFRIAFLGSKNSLKALFGEIRNVEPSRKKEFGQAINAVKQQAEAKFESIKAELSQSDDNVEVPNDLTLPVNATPLGSRHPIALVRNQIIDIFKRIGFTISEGPEIEDDWHNFTALNFPPDHPARDMQDTFFIHDDISLRTHTSSVQVRVMENTEPPIRTISPGRVYRNETISARAHCQFHQVEGLYVDEGVSFADLKQTLYFFAQEMYGKDTEIRFRPSYFPFTEISAEMDISCFVCGGWVEILGCGMVDPNVLENCGIDSEKYTAYAFGMGVERIAMLKYKINDIRLMFENDVRFLGQFAAAR